MFNNRFSRRVFLAGSLLSTVPLATSFAQESGRRPGRAARKRREVNGVWVSTVSNIDYPSKPGLSADQMRAEADATLDRAAQLRLNTVFLQVRPMGDAYYPSNIYPWSNFLSGEQGKAPDGDFDALAYWVEGARRRGIKLHAWVNPYRVAVGGRTLDDLAETNPARLHPEWTFQRDGKIFLDPGLPETRELVVAGMVEIVKNYDVDGIHIDDYFYPARDMTEDQATFEKYGEGFDNIEDWRRHNVDLLIESAGKAIHKARKNAQWGVSPAGIWANKSSNPLGSETRGNQCYYNLFADVRGWIKNEWIDYVVPQIYWHIGFEIADFVTLVDWWADVVSDVDVDLYIGTAAYRVDPNSKTEAWRDPEQLTKQLEYMDSIPEVDGRVFFTAHSLAPGTPAGDVVERYGKERWRKPRPRRDDRN